MVSLQVTGWQEHGRIIKTYSSSERNDTSSMRKDHYTLDIRPFAFYPPRPRIDKYLCSFVDRFQRFTFTRGEESGFVRGVDTARREEWRKGVG